jgi:hypothetical protein
MNLLSTTNLLQDSSPRVDRDPTSIAGSIPDEVVDFFNLHNPFSRTIAQGSTQPLTEMNTRNLPGGKGRPACKTDNFTAICEPTV